MIEIRGSFLRLTRERLRAGRVPWIVGHGLRFAATALAERLRLRPLTGPALGTLVITYRCTYSCPMCSVARDSAGDELDTAAVEALVDEFAALGTPGLAITGGEPLLRQDVFRVVRRAKERGLIVNLSTNGHLLVEDGMIDRILAHPPDNINVSLDSAAPSRHDRFRGCPGSFDRVVAGIRQLAERRAESTARFHITVVNVLTKHSVAEVDALCDLAGRLGADAVGFIPYHDFNDRPSKVDDRDRDAIKAGVESLLARKRSNVSPIIDNSRRYLEMLPLALAGAESPVHCSSGYTTCYVDANGDVFGCWPDVELHRPIGNLAGRSLRSIWRSTTYHRRRREMGACRSCFWNCQTELNLLFRPFRRIPAGEHLGAPTCGHRGGEG